MMLRATLDELHATLKANDQITDEEWLASLSERKRKELEFHDRDRNRAEMQKLDSDTFERFYGNKKYYESTGRCRRYVQEWIEANAPEKVFLDYACGNGKYAIAAARASARLAIGIDISRVSIENARDDARAAGVEATTRFVQGDAEDTRLPDNSVDVVVCSGMLHHLDLSFAFPELRRILAPGGKILAIESLDYNPAIKMYRWMTPEMRTTWEAAHILSLKDIRFARRFFHVQEMRYWHVTGILAPHLRFLPAKVFDAVDLMIERTPLLQLMAWMFTFVLEKKDSG